MSSQTRVIIVVAIVACAVLFAVGILIGHFAIDKDGGKSEEQRGLMCGSTQYSDPWDKYQERYA